MKYMGSKNKIAKEILPIILENRLSDDQWYVEPFVGGCNSIDKASGNRLGADINEYLIAMLDEFVKFGIHPIDITKEIYDAVRKNKDGYGKAFVGWVGFNCSYSGKFFARYAGKVKTKVGVIRDYQEEASRHMHKQRLNLKDVIFKCCKYSELDIPSNSIIYCDPPYRGTTQYNQEFSHDDFYNWCRRMKQLGHSIFISEYDMPNDFICVWEKEIKSSLSANGKSGGSKASVEKLFTL